MPLGGVAVPGNHDHGTAPDAIRTALRRAGIVVRSHAALRRGAIALPGVDDAYSGHDDAAQTVAWWRHLGGIPVVLTHAPDLVRSGPANYRCCSRANRIAVRS
ncbi:hypothetical protein [Sphingomonas sp. TDK1]|uniref:hypothetical protein n=1 Tax=Sphingomonas sp. TDK1 TaxID=453247 RepID=UPI000B29E378|nr:hypothetical protein [Sphingomonas sp. TDK1]